MSNENPIKVKLKPAQSIKTKTNNTYLWDPSFLGLVGETLEKADELVEKTAGLDEQVQAIQEVVDAQVIIINDPTYQAVSQNLPAINTVGSSISGVNTVAGSISNVNTVAGDISRVDLVADDISSVHTVAIDISNVIDVAANISDINTAAANITDIQNASANALLAKNWAIKMDGVVEGSDYSAKYNASLAANSATSASSSAASAAQSAIEASQSAALVKTNLPLLYHFWSDHKINDVCYLRGDTFSWQSGNVYRRAFEHLADDLLMNRPYIIPVNGFNTKFFRNPENDTETQFAWTQGFSILYTDKDYPASGDPIYYIGSVADYVDEFAFGSGEYIITSLSADNKYYREADEDDSVNGYYAWMFDSSTKVYTTSATPVATDDIYTKSGGTYTSAGTVASVLLGPASSTETIGGHTITYYTAEDGHKIVLASQESTVLDIYNSTGAAWYYIFDEENIRFKLPRINPAREELITLMRAKGNGKSLGLTDGTNDYGLAGTDNNTVDRFTLVSTTTANSDIGDTVAKTSANSNFNNMTVFGVNTDATKSGIITDPTNSDTVFAGSKYLYFYVGNFTQTAIENTAGLNASLFNDKADIDLDNINPSASAKQTIVGWGTPDWSSGVSVSDPFTATYDGLLLVKVIPARDLDRNLYINGTLIQQVHTYYNTLFYPLNLKQGDVFSSTGNATLDLTYYRYLY